MDPELVEEKLLVVEVGGAAPSPGTVYIGSEEVEAASDPMSKDMKGMAELSWNGGVGTRRCWRLRAVGAGLPAGGKKWQDFELFGMTLISV